MAAFAAEPASCCFAASALASLLRLLSRSLNFSCVFRTALRRCFVVAGRPCDTASPCPAPRRQLATEPALPEDHIRLLILLLNLWITISPPVVKRTTRPLAIWSSTSFATSRFVPPCLPPAASSCTAAASATRPASGRSIEKVVPTAVFYAPSRTAGFKR